MVVERCLEVWKVLFVFLTLMELMEDLDIVLTAVRIDSLQEDLDILWVT